MVCEVFILKMVSIDIVALSQFEQCSSWVFVLRRSKAGLKSLKENRLRGQLTITGHPLKPGQGVPIHVEGGDGQSIVLGRGMVIEELVDLIDLTKGFDPIKAGNIEFRAMRGGGGHGWWVIGRRKGWR